MHLIQRCRAHHDTVLQVTSCLLQAVEGVSLLARYLMHVAMHWPRGRHVKAGMQVTCYTHMQVVCRIPSSATHAAMTKDEAQRDRAQAWLSDSTFVVLVAVPIYQVGVLHIGHTSFVHGVAVCSCNDEARQVLE